uniref:Uncharacterized protein n=1 Tax=Tanacetum cinerariifolium TaxID=118510 RepID=A0A6L2MD47_TANCI|nr:hypothetical protein [Tanacetum cinerariifolium]
MLFCYEPDTMYGLHPIWRVLDESAFAVEINFTWSLRVQRIFVVALVKSWPCCSVLSCISFSGNDTFRFKDLSGGNIEPIIKQAEGQYTVMIIQNTPYCLEEQIRCLDYKDQYDVLSGKADTSYPTGGYGLSVDLS